MAAQPCWPSLDFATQALTTPRKPAASSATLSSGKPTHTFNHGEGYGVGISINRTQQDGGGEGVFVCSDLFTEFKSNIKGHIGTQQEGGCFGTVRGSQSSIMSGLYSININIWICHLHFQMILAAIVHRVFARPHPQATAGRPVSLQYSPDSRVRLSPFQFPFIGFSPFKFEQLFEPGGGWC